MLLQKSKITLGLIIVLLILAGIYFLAPSLKETPSGLLSETIIEPDKLDTITKIEISATEKQTVLEKAGEDWIITNQENLPASEIFINSLIQALKETPEGSIVSQNPDKLINFSLNDEQASKLKLFNQDELVLDLLIGKLSQTYTETYVKKADSDNVLLIQGNLISNINHEDWRQPPPEPATEDDEAEIIE